MLNSCRRTGFTLIELAMVLVLAGLMLGFGLQATQGPDKCYEATREQMATIQQAIDQYVIANKRYPKPAGKNYGVNHPRFGREAATPDVELEQATSGEAGVVVGALPFQALGLPSSFAADCWGNKFTYSVNLHLTLPAGFKQPHNVGTIPVITDSRANPVYLTQKAAYVVISHGPNAIGATPRNYSAAPTAKINCNYLYTHDTTLQLDLPNCYTGNTLYFSAPYNTGNDPIHFFDDIVVFAEKPVFSCDLPQTVNWPVATPACAGAATNATNRLSTLDAPLVVNNTTAGRNGYATVQCLGDGTLDILNEVCLSFPGTWLIPTCSKTCDGITSGVTVVTCSTGNDADCDPAKKPVVGEVCANPATCIVPTWIPTPCSASCGGGTFDYTCSTGNDADCIAAIGPKPAGGSCNAGACPYWIEACSATCGDGTKTSYCSTHNDADCNAATRPSGTCKVANCVWWMPECRVRYNACDWQETLVWKCSSGNDADCASQPYPAGTYCTDYHETGACGDGVGGPDGGDTAGGDCGCGGTEGSECSGGSGD